MNTTTPLKDRAISIPETMPADTGWVRVLARMRAISLDRRLAAGEAAASERLLAARADLLISRQGRQRLAADWEHVLARARRPIAPRSPQLPVQSAAILAAEHHVRELVVLIRQPAPVNPQGIALARQLLTDGTGPLYNPRRSTELVAALQSAAATLMARD